MGQCTGKDEHNPLAKQFKISKNKFTKMEIHLLRKIFSDLSSRSKGITMAKDDFLRFFPLTGLWGDRMFEKFDLMQTGNINYEEFIIGLGNSAKLTQEESIKYLFNVYDLTNDNCITKSELLMMLYNYPQEDLKQITKDPYFTEKQSQMNKQRELKDEPSFNATSQFFQSQIQDFMKSRSTITLPSQQSQKPTTNNIARKVSQSHHMQLEIEEIGDVEPQINQQITLNIRQISQNASQYNKKNDKLQQEIQYNKSYSNNNNRRNSTYQRDKQPQSPLNGSSKIVASLLVPAQKNNNKRHTQVPIKASNLTNIIKQYCDFIFREYDTDRLDYQMFRQFCMENETLFNIFTDTFYFGFWGEINGKMEYKFKKLDMSGHLLKLKKNTKQLKKYYYELRENFLIYFAEKDHKPLGMLCMDGLIVREKSANEQENLDPQLKKKLQGLVGLEIYHKDDFYKSKNLFCKLEERKKWMDNLIQYSKTNFKERYELLEKIGVGRFSVVYKGNKKENPQESIENLQQQQIQYAIKVMQKRDLTQEEIQFISYETETMRYLSHPGIITVFETFEDKNNIYIVTELVSDGDLFQYIHQNEFLEEVEISILMKQLFATLLYIHEAGIMHRDLKPENIMVVKNKDQKEQSKQTVKQIKIIDFGFSKMLQLGQQCEGFCGSQNYMAPEVIKNQLYDQKVDNFALGCIMFFMLRGSLPFDSWDPDEGKFSLVDDHWNNISPQAKDLIQKLLKVDPDERISLREALQHEFITQRKTLEKYKGKNTRGTLITDSNNLS